MPLGFEPSWWEELKIEGYATRPNENMSIFRNVISPGYLPLMHIPIVEGRNFTEQDNEDLKSPAVMIVNQPFEQGRLFRSVRGKALPGWAAEFDCASWAQLFLKYLIGDPAVTVVIPATDKPDHMADNLKAGYGRLPDVKQREQIRRFWDGL